MRTMFQMGFASKDLFGLMNPYMGQADAPLSNADRNKLLDDIGAAGEKFQAVNAWLQNHPNQQADLGADYQSFKTALDNSSSFASTAAAVSQRLASDQPANWVVSATDWNASNNWIMFVNQVYEIISRHPGSLPGGIIPVGTPGTRPGTPGYVAPAAAAAGSPMSPLAIGATAVGVVGLLAILLRS